MNQYPHYLVGWMIVFLVAGVAWYVFDRRVGLKLYRVYYDWTNRDPLPAGESRGFVFNQKARVRFAWAVALSTLQSVLIVWRGSVNPMVELASFILEVPAMMAGFYLGPAFFRVWQRKDRVLQKIDALEEGKTSVAEITRDAVTRAGEAVRDAFVHEQAPEAPEQFPAPVQPNPSTSPAAARQAEPAPPTQPAAANPERTPTEKDHRDALGKFIGGGGNR